MRRSASQHRAVLFLTLSAGCIAASADNTDIASSLKRALAPCTALTDRDKRLDCFDALASGAAPPASTASVAVVPAAPASSSAPEPRAEDFGLTAAQQERAKPHAQLDSITGVVSSIWTSKSGRMLLELDNGQSWELDRADRLLAAGDKVKIEHAAMGSFMLTTPTRRNYHVRRLH